MRYWRSKNIQGNPCVGIGVAAYFTCMDRRYFALRSLVATFQAQTWQNWKMRIVHDGPVPQEIASRITVDFADDRVSFVNSDTRLQKFGHPHRQSTLDYLFPACEWVMLTNDDNYYAPVFLEWLLSEGLGVDLVYCDMIHSHRSWQLFVTKPKYRHIDLGAFIVRSSLASQVKFDNFNFGGDGDWVNRLASLAGRKVKKVPAVLFVHN